MARKHKKFNDHPFEYHQVIELEIVTLTNLGLGLGRVPLPKEVESGVTSETRNAGWVVMVPFTLPGERVRVRVYRNHKNYSEADLVEVLTPSADRVAPRCPLFGKCGGCQYQHLSYPEQLTWKQRQVAELLEHMAGVIFPVSPVVPSPREYGYRSKITPHFAAPRRPPLRSLETGQADPTGKEDAGQGLEPPDSDVGFGNQNDRAEFFPIGFLRQGTRFDIVDVPHCPIATEAINVRLGAVREAVHAKAASYTRGATLLLREASGIVTTDYDAVITETIAASRPPSLRLHFLARDFFQNNPFILPAFTSYVRDQAAGTGARFLIDAYCGSGLFALSAASAFDRVAGVEISESSVRFARENATANAIPNATFLAADAGAIFAGVGFPPAETAVIIDPPRKGCDESFLQQLFAFGPGAVVYVSCDPATQMRDLRHFLGAGYELTAAQPFDLFPQTRHLECVLTLVRKSAPAP
ncbi:MAG TPA: class I SAM-dependent RNA methyltransferase [Opitutaceae bacterium]|nr:class I SAM-dependent RNA methyltransferase [Opitutaceae bacterium]